MKTKIDYDIACYIRQFADFNGLYYKAVVNDLLERAIVSEVGEEVWKKLIYHYEYYGRRPTDSSEWDKREVPKIIGDALIDGRICEDHRGGCDNWSYDNGKKPFDCGGNPKPDISYQFCLGEDGEDDVGYSEASYCGECTIKMLGKG